MVRRQQYLVACAVRCFAGANAQNSQCFWSSQLLYVGIHVSDALKEQLSVGIFNVQVDDELDDFFLPRLILSSAQRGSQILAWPRR